ncbi:MAG: site-specific integrase [Alphaproteobacteria bacterium]
MPKQHLTVRGVDNLRAPKSGRIEIWDASKPGFGVRMSSAGIKSWVVMYRVAGKAGNNRGRITLGRVGDQPPALTLADARERAETILAKARGGIDPARKKIAASAAASPGDITFRWLATEYMDRKCPTIVRGEEIKRLINVALMPTWGDLPLAEIRKRHARDILDEMWTERPAAGLFLLETIKSIFNWGLRNRDEELESVGVVANPLQFLEPEADRVKRDRVLSHDEIRALWPVWSAMGYPFGDVMKLLLLTGARRDEIGALQRDEIDWDNRWIKLSPDRNKSDRHFLLPLSDTAIQILESAPDFEEGSFVFSTTGGRRPVSGFSKPKDDARDQSGIDGWSYHDLRRTLRTELSRLKVDPIVRERVINHAPRGLDAIYDQFDYLDGKRESLQAWADELRTILKPRPTPSSADNVVTMPRRNAGAA